MEKKLYRDDYNKSVGGVCIGLAEYFAIDVSIVRVVFVILGFIHGVGVPLYVILWAILPKKPYSLFNVDYTVPDNGPFAGQGPVPPVFNQPKKTSTAITIVGAFLVIIGMGFLLNELNLIPDIDFDYIWPLAIIAVGVIIIFSGKKQPWEQPNWEKKDTFKDSFQTESKEPTTEDGHATNDNNTTV